MQSRRSVLRAGAGGAGVALVALLPGCSDLLSSDSEREEGEDDGSYTDWVYEPAAVDTESLEIERVDIGAVLALEQASKEEFEEDVSDELDDVDWTEIEYYLEFDSNTIMAVSFDAGVIVGEMDLESLDGHGDFDLYEDDEAGEEGIVATDGDFIIDVAEDDDRERSARERVELLIDTYAGDEDRFSETNEYYRQAIDELGTAQVVEVEADASSAVDSGDDGVVASGSAMDVTGETTTMEMVEVYVDEDAYDIDDVESGYEFIANFEEDLELVEVTGNGRAVVATFEIPTDAVFEDDTGDEGD